MSNATPRRGFPAWIAALLIVAASLSCRHALPTKPDYRDRLSAVASVTAPDTVAVGDSFVVEITTAGANGCWRRGHDDVSRPAPLEVKITPYDREYIGLNACPLNVPVFLHKVSLIASDKGTIEISVLHRLRAVSGADSTGTIKLGVLAR